MALKSFVKIKLILGKTSSNKGVLDSIKIDEVKPSTEIELPLKEPPPIYPPIEISVCENVKDE
jgi:hypothetical protein